MKPGDLLCNRYQIEKALAAGGFGETYLAIDLHLPSKPQVVVKHLKPLNNDPATLQIAKRMFEAEAKVLEELGKNSKRIPTLYTYFEDKIEKQVNRMVERHSEFYLVQEFINGQTLAAELKLAGGQLSESQVIEILQEILAGLQEVHEKGKIHRDLKPDNIIRRSEDGRLVLIDFGAVKEVRRATSIGANVPLSATVSIGTPGYTPAEQWRGNPRPASDLWEWCLDEWNNDHNDASPEGIARGNIQNNNKKRLLRGGSWRDRAAVCRSANRVSGDVSFVYNYDTGLRVVLSSRIS